MVPLSCAILNQKGKIMEGDMMACDFCGTPIDARNTPQWHELTEHGFLCEPCQERIDEALANC